MPFTLHNLRPSPGSQHSTRRLGRGHGSGRGKTAGRGTKGQKARTGGRKGLKRLGMKRIILQQPKLRGFRSIHPKPNVINIGDLAAAFPVGSRVDAKAIVAKELLRATRDGIKVLGRGDCPHALTLVGLEVSGPAKEKVVKAGGKVE